MLAGDRLYRLAPFAELIRAHDSGPGVDRDRIPPLTRLGGLAVHETGEKVMIALGSHPHHPRPVTAPSSIRRDGELIRDATPGTFPAVTAELRYLSHKPSASQDPQVIGTRLRRCPQRPGTLSRRQPVVHPEQIEQVKPGWMGQGPELRHPVQRCGRHVLYLRPGTHLRRQSLLSAPLKLGHVCCLNYQDHRREERRAAARAATPMHGPASGCRVAFQSSIGVRAG